MYIWNICQRCTSLHTKSGADELLPAIPKHLFPMSSVAGSFWSWRISVASFPDKYKSHAGRICVYILVCIHVYIWARRFLYICAQTYHIYIHLYPRCGYIYIYMCAFMMWRHMTWRSSSPDISICFHCAVSNPVHIRAYTLCEFNCSLDPDDLVSIIVLSGSSLWGMASSSPRIMHMFCPRCLRTINEVVWFDASRRNSRIIQSTYYSRIEACRCLHRRMPNGLQR